ncbi:hypothetical protein [Chelativorans intermedius]|uniref:Uncharacterized protein n=1 Tax=Chelativorans intermedius TaxID=515947 RepID=A0ABV6D658_9HYPH|nr:hypothetical protein [Chelativorans intermedius]MCT8999377.1 hypothetical protein [Chelativorans intermedius]
MKTSLSLMATAIASPALAHGIAANHSHVGGTVLFHLSPLLVLGAGIALIVFRILCRRGEKIGRGRHDPR